MNQEKIKDRQNQDNLQGVKNNKIILKLKLKNISFRTQLLFSLIPGIFIPLLITSFFGYKFVNHNAQKRIETSLLDYGILTKNFFYDSTETTSFIPILVANTPSILQVLYTANSKVQEQKLNYQTTRKLEKNFNSTKSIINNITVNEFLKTTVKNSDYIHISITEKTGLNIAYSKSPLSLVQHNKTWWKQAKEHGEYIGKVDFESSTNTSVLVLAHSIKDPKTGNFLGIVKSVLPIEYFNKLKINYFTNINLTKTQAIQLVDPLSEKAISTVGLDVKNQEITNIIGGKKIAVIAHFFGDNYQIAQKSKTLFLNKIKSDIPIKQVRIEEFEQQNEAKALALSFQYNERQYTIIPLENTNFFVISSVEVADIETAGKELLSIFLMVIIVVFLIIAVIIIFLANKLVHPVEELAIRAEEVVSGNLDILVNPKGTKETQLLGNSFNRMIETVNNSLQKQNLALQEAQETRKEAENFAQQQSQKNAAIQKELLNLLKNVEEASKGDLTVRSQINETEIGIVADFFNSIIESLQDIVGQVKHTVDLVSESVDKNKLAINELATESSQQAEQINQTLFSVEQMTISIQKVAQNAQEAAKVANLASLKAETGGKQMKRTANSIMQLQVTIDETADKVKQLGAASQQISRVISLINQIAMQTNLLAINASIEAARAGEAGKGFAVVAEEVGQLANQSSEATKEVEVIVATIQKEIAQVVDGIEIGTNQALEGTRLVENTQISFEQIVQVSHQIDRLIQSISDNTISQAQTSETVTKLMKQIAQLSKRTSTASVDVTYSLETTVEIAQKLQSSVDTFKV